MTDLVEARQVNHQCPSCRTRWKHPAPAPRELYGPLYIDRKAYRWLENAARVFDEHSGEDIWTAADFVAWVRNDIYGERPPMVEHDGASTIRRDLRHPDPLPLAGWRPSMREGAE